MAFSRRDGGFARQSVIHFFDSTSLSKASRVYDLPLYSNRTASSSKIATVSYPALQERYSSAFCERFNFTVFSGETMYVLVL